MFRIGDKLVFRFENKTYFSIACCYWANPHGLACIFANGLVVDLTKIEVIFNLGQADSFYVTTEFLQIAKDFRVDCAHTLNFGNLLLLIKINKVVNNIIPIYEANFCPVLHDSRRGEYLNRDGESIDFENDLVIATGESVPFLLSNMGIRSLEKAYPFDI